MMSSRIPVGIVESVKFWIAGDEENLNDAFVTITDKAAFSGVGGSPTTGGIYDSKMGTTSNNYKCGTCGNTKELCPGHCGVIKLSYPVQNALFKEDILKILRIICLECGNILISLKSQNNKHQSKDAIKEHLKLRRAAAGKDKPIICNRCGAEHPSIVRNDYDQLQIYKKYQDPFGKILTERIYNKTILSIFEKISDDDLHKLGRNKFTHPKKLILNYLNVPPNPIRPNIERGLKSASAVNDITGLLRNIMDINMKIIQSDEITKFDKKTTDSADLLEILVHELIRGTSTTSKKTKAVMVSGQSPMSLADRLPKKSGLIRAAITGKRTRYSGRSVISCDPTIQIDELGIPIKVARIILIPVVVNPWNIDELNRYFANKNKEYPGCSKLWKKNVNKTYDVSNIGPDVVLEIGDVLHRHLIDGDVVAFNRAPSFSPSHISTHKVKIRDGESNTFQMNISACVLYSADFDGDEMTCHFPLSKLTQIEIKLLMSISERSISYQYGSHAVAIVQDSLIGACMFTFYGQNFDKFTSMRLLAGTIRDYSSLETNPDQSNPFIFEKQTYSNYELLTKIMPDINYSNTPSIYKPNLAHIIKYNENDIRVSIKNGVYEKGILDKKTIGQNTTNSIVHIIHNKYGGNYALKFIYNMQQLISNYLKYYGFSLGIKDMLVSKDINEKVAVLTSSIIGAANEITERLNQNAIIPPIGMTIEMFYEQQQMNALTIADDFYNVILSEEINIKDPLYAIVASGSKGNFKNYIAINSTIGQQTINGERMDMKFGYYRTLPYFTSWDTSPNSRGFIYNSYLSGMTSTETFFAAKDARFALIAQALTTATTGAQSRTSVKNLEPIIIDNNRFASKEKLIVQLIYGDSGFDPRFLEISSVLTSDISNEEFNKYHWSIKMIDKKYQNKDLQLLFDEEFEQLKSDRNLFREIMLKIENHSGTSNRIYGNKFKTPINIVKIINDVLVKYKDTDPKLNYGDAILLVRETCKKLPYSAFNDIMWEKKTPLPDYWDKSMTFARILIRSYLNTRNMIFQGINNQMLQIICDQIYNLLCNAYMPYGAAVGVIAAQSMSEPLTQFVLDSKHRSGGSGTKTDKVVRVAEIFGARPTDKMKSVSMVIQVNDEISGDEKKVQDIANHIEMINVSKFLTNGMELFYEKYGEPTYPKYKHEKELIANFNKQNPLLKVPADLIPWCIRFELNRREMIFKNMDLDSIIKTIQTIKDLFVVYTSELSKDLIVRCYIRTTSVKKDDVLGKMKDLIDDISNLIIRGITGITHAEVSKEQLLRTYITEEGTIKTKKIYYITTDGTNLEAVLGVDDIDPYHVQSDSIIEIAETYGIEAAREKIINELKTINNATIDNGVCLSHCTIYADEMTITGEVTSIERTGINKRDGGILLRISTASPVQAFEEAAKNNMEDMLENASASLMIGCTPKIGSTYNTPIINTSFIEKSVIQTSAILDDL